MHHMKHITVQEKIKAMLNTPKAVKEKVIIFLPKKQKDIHILK